MVLGCGHRPLIVLSRIFKKIDTGISKGQIQPTCSNCVMFKARQKHNYIIFVILDDDLSISCLFLKTINPSRRGQTVSDSKMALAVIDSTFVDTPLRHFLPRIQYQLTLEDANTRKKGISFPGTYICLVLKKHFFFKGIRFESSP